MTAPDDGDLEADARSGCDEGRMGPGGHVGAGPPRAVGRAGLFAPWPGARPAAPRSSGPAPYERPDLLTRFEVMSYLMISSTTLWRLSVEGRLPRVRIGRRVLYRKDDVDALVRRSRRAV